MAAADAIYGRLDDAIEISPETVLETDAVVFENAGVSRRKASTVQAVADAFQERAWSQAYFDRMSDKAVINELTEVSGVGVWTAKMQLMFSLGRPDVFPVEDLGIRRAMQTLTTDEITRSSMVDTAERWRPHRSVASLYLWKVSDD